MVEQEVAACLHELVSKVIDDSAGDCPGVRMRKRLRGDARVFDGDVINCMNAELDAAQRQAVAPLRAAAAGARPPRAAAILPQAAAAATAALLPLAD